MNLYSEQMLYNSNKRYWIYELESSKYAFEEYGKWIIVDVVEKNRMKKNKKKKVVSKCS